MLIEYVMLKGINDKPEHASQLLELLHGIEAKINLIVFNPHEGKRMHALPKYCVCHDSIKACGSF